MRVVSGRERGNVKKRLNLAIWLFRWHAALRFGQIILTVSKKLNPEESAANTWTGDKDKLARQGVGAGVRSIDGRYHQKNRAGRNRRSPRPNQNRWPGPLLGFHPRLHRRNVLPIQKRPSKTTMRLAASLDNLVKLDPSILVMSVRLAMNQSSCRRNHARLLDFVRGDCSNLYTRIVAPFFSNYLESCKRAE